MHVRSLHDRNSSSEPDCGSPARLQSPEQPDLDVPLVEGAGDDEHDVVDHVTVGAVVQELAQRLVSLRSSADTDVIDLRGWRPRFLMAEGLRAPSRSPRTSDAVQCRDT